MDNNANKNSFSRDTTNSFALHLNSSQSVTPTPVVFSGDVTASFIVKDDLDLDLDGNNKSRYLPIVQSNQIDTSDFQGDSATEWANLASDSDSSLSPECKPTTEKAEPFKASINPGIGNFMGNVINNGITGEFDGLNFPHCEIMMEVLRSKFGMGSFRLNQLQIINAAMLGHDCFVLMPTGGGKSLCYQLPALLCPGVTIVVSPLRALILDQVQYLLSLDIAAVSLTSDVPKSEQDLILEKLQSNPSEIKLVYICPEKLTPSCKLLNVLKSLYDRNQLSRFIIDEAHCVSQWGHDFRPHYVGLAILKKNFPRVPFMAVTATATPRVRLDILHQLGIPNAKWFLSSFDRPNLKYEVKLNNRKDFIAVLKSPSLMGKSGIVYCLSRKDCEETAERLRRCGINAAHYHAGLKGTERKEVQNKWLNDLIHVICATIAFGMGIDKRDVRFVIHHTLPSSIEDYFQMSGRAGRDGNPSVCILYFCHKDVERWEGLMGDHYAEKCKSKEQASITKQNLYLMVEYCQNPSKCRRVHMLEYFGQIFSSDSCKQNPASICDNCARTTSSDALHQRCLQELVAKCNEMAKKFKTTFPAVMGIEALKSMSLELPETPQQMLQTPGVTKDKGEQYGFQLLDITVRYSTEKSLLLNSRKRYGARSNPWKRKRGGSWEEEREGYDHLVVNSSSSTTSLCSNSTYGGGFGGGSGGNGGYGGSGKGHATYYVIQKGYI